MMAGLILLIAAVHVVDRMIACTANGLTYTAALEISNRKLKTHMRNNASDFVLIDSQFDNLQKWWGFSYKSNDCEIAIIIDECGEADIGGLSEGCIRKR